MVAVSSVGLFCCCRSVTAQVGRFCIQYVDLIYRDTHFWGVNVDSREVQSRPVSDPRRDGKTKDSIRGLGDRSLVQLIISAPTPVDVI